MKIREIFFPLGMMLFVLPAMASENHWYFGGALHFVSIDDGTTRFRSAAEEGLFGSPAQDFRFESSIGGDTALSLLLGWDAPGYGLRTELEYRQFKSDIKRFGTDDTGQIFTDDAEARQLMLMAWYDFHDIDFLPDRVVPYLGLGVGAVNLKLDGESDTGVMVQFGAGVSYRITDLFTVELSYRYFEAEPLSYEPPSGDVSTKYKGDTIALGLRWYFTRGEYTWFKRRR